MRIRFGKVLPSRLSNSLLVATVKSQTMKTLFIWSVIICTALPFSPALRGQTNLEANKVARQASLAAKDQDWENAVDGFRKAVEMDRKYVPNLVASLQQRANAYINEQRFAEAITDLNDAIKLNPKDAGIYERRAYVEMKGNEYDKALADYSEAIKINPGEARYYLYRGYLLEVKGDFKGAMADTEKVLKMQKGNAEAQARKTRLETRLKAENPQANPPPSPPPPPKK